MSGGQRSFFRERWIRFHVCVLSFYHANFAHFSDRGTEKVFALEWALHHIKLRTPIDQFRDCLYPIFLCVSIPPDQILATSSSLCNVTVSNLLLFYFKAPFFSKRRRLSPFSSLSSRVVFLFLFARNCDALPHTRTHEPSLPTRNLPADNLESGRISIMPPPPSFHNAPLSRHQEKF
jgi:hypothetical protein